MAVLTCSTRCNEAINLATPLAHNTAIDIVRVSRVSFALFRLFFSLLLPSIPAHCFGLVGGCSLNFSNVFRIISFFFVLNSLGLCYCVLLASLFEVVAVHFAHTFIFNAFFFFSLTQSYFKIVPDWWRESIPVPQHFPSFAHSRAREEFCLCFLREGEEKCTHQRFDAAKTSAALLQTTNCEATTTHIVQVTWRNNEIISFPSLVHTQRSERAHSWTGEWIATNIF